MAKNARVQTTILVIDGQISPYAAEDSGAADLGSDRLSARPH
jgi:hypothetical protein